MNKLRKAFLALAVAAPLAIGVGTGTAHANPPSVPQCRIDFDSLTATSLWNGSKDWVWVVMNGNYSPGNFASVDFMAGTTQVASAFGNPYEVVSSGGSVTFQVVLDRTWPKSNLVVDSNTVSCATTGYNLSLRFSNGTAVYDMRYDARIV